MTPRPISPNNVRPGDRVRWVYDSTIVEGEVLEPVRDGWLCLRGGIDALHLHPSAEVTLLDRPLPPIPTTPGTIVRRKGSGYLYRRNALEWKSVSSGAPLRVEPTRDEFDVLVPEVSA